MTTHALPLPRTSVRDRVLVQPAIDGLFFRDHLHRELSQAPVVDSRAR